MIYLYFEKSNGVPHLPFDYLHGVDVSLYAAKRGQAITNYALFHWFRAGGTL